MTREARGPRRPFVKVRERITARPSRQFSRWFTKCSLALLGAIDSREFLTAILGASAVWPILWPKLAQPGAILCNRSRFTALGGSPRRPTPRRPRLVRVRRSVTRGARCERRPPARGRRSRRTRRCPPRSRRSPADTRRRGARPTAPRGPG